MPTHPLPYIDQNDRNHFQIGKWGWNVQFGPLQNCHKRKARGNRSKKDIYTGMENGRCIIPLDGYYEWVSKTNRIPYRITLPDGELFQWPDW